MRETYVRSDAEVIAEALEDPGQFTEIYRRHSLPVFRYIASRLDRECAEDLRSETFLVAFESRHRFRDGVISALPWLLGIATQLIRRRRREEAHAWKLAARVGGLGEEGSIHGGVDPGTDVDNRLDADATARSLATAMTRLSRGDRDVLGLAAWSDLDTAGIAEALDIAEGTVRTRLHRARKTLRTHIDASAACTTERDYARTR